MNRSVESYEGAIATSLNACVGRYVAEPVKASSLSTTSCRGVSVAR
jgi:hypothetical protein